MYDDFDREWKEGDRAKAKAIAQKYVNTDPAFSMLTSMLEGLTIEELVALIDRKRTASDEDGRRRVDMYLLVNREPQRIVGSFAA